MPFVTSKNPQIPVPPTPSDRRVHTLSLKSGPLMATPPRARKMTPERPFPALIETAKSHPKTGLCPVVCRWFAGGLGRRSHRHLDHHHKRVQVATTSRNAGGFGGPVATWTTQDLEGALNRLTAPHGRKFRRCIPKPYSPLDYGCSIMSAGRNRGCANRPLRRHSGPCLAPGEE